MQLNTARYKRIQEYTLRALHSISIKQQSASEHSHRYKRIQEYTLRALHSISIKQQSASEHSHRYKRIQEYTLRALHSISIKQQSSSGRDLVPRSRNDLILYRSIVFTPRLREYLCEVFLCNQMINKPCDSRSTSLPTEMNQTRNYTAIAMNNWRTQNKGKLQYC